MILFTFTSLIQSLHISITEELTHRKKLTDLPDNDYKHLNGDVRRVYSLLIVEWLDYMGHLKRDYPYLFSLASRMNPFDADISVEVK